MRATWIVLAAGLALPAAGCIVDGHHGHVSGGVAVSTWCDHHFLFYPDYGAYHCGSCDHWWVRSGGSWVHHASRPSHLHLSAGVTVLRVDERDREPWVHYDRHMRKARPGKGHDGGKGPPLGRGWKK